jgi:PAS domain S-box-containing protein
MSEQKRDNEGLLHYLAILECCDDAIIAKNLDGVILSWNPAAQRIFGYAAEEAIGQSITIIIPPELRDDEVGILRRLKAGERIEHYETLRITKDGRRLNVSITASPIRDAEDRIIGVSKIARDITSRKTAEAALRDSQEALRTSEERLRLGQWAAHVGTFDLSLRTGVDIWTPETEALYGLPPGGFGGTLTAFENLIHPDDRERVIELTQELIRTRRPVDSEWRTVWPDGSVHWIAGRGQVLVDESGEPSRLLGVNMDVTERKQAEEALSAMTWKLVEAQEQERARIARELHDDTNQRLALLALELSQLQKNNELPSDVRDRMDKLQQMTSEIAMGVHNLSHELHFATLDYVGLVSGMRSWCEEYGARQKLEIDFKGDDVPTLPQSTSLCLFRVLQEALHNAAKYSGVKRIEVQLTKNSGEIHLIVSDSGRGFDVAAAKRKRGLGLTSMQERVRLVGGTIMIDSKPLAGTTIHVYVPFAERNAQMAAG